MRLALCNLIFWGFVALRVLNLFCVFILFTDLCKTKANGDMVTGAWEDDDLKDGMGKVKYSNGSVYEGNFKRGKRNGKGNMTYKYLNLQKGGVREGLRWYAMVAWSAMCSAMVRAAV
jgi:hypothetical protein